LQASNDALRFHVPWVPSQSELCKLCFDGFVTSAVSGFEDSVLLHGRPFGGCAILYCESLVSSIRQISTSSRRFCAIKINFCGCTCLLINAYLPTDYRSSASTELFKDTLGEIASFIAVTSHDFVVIAGDWNVDMQRAGDFSDAVRLFLGDLTLSLADLHFPGDIGFTYLGHDGYKSWLDHVAISSHFLLDITAVNSILDGRNLSDVCVRTHTLF